ncbi:hypothetical protein [Microbaculum sp. FT89]|uniref:hypothetical protein n=1 Tax=Microbaculum sp. FT89 TaxID=3447298 RepID=UPI003F52B9C4
MRYLECSYSVNCEGSSASGWVQLAAAVPPGRRRASASASSASATPGGGPQRGTIGAAPAMGDDMPERTGNSARSIQEGKLVAMMVVARRPA